MGSNDSVTSHRRHVIEMASGTSISFRLIPDCPNGFLMGSRGYDSDEEPIHRVVIPEGFDFWMGETLVTQAQFAVWTQKAGIEHKNQFDGNPNHPAESMTWRQANDFCGWLTERYSNKFPDDHWVAKLPTESQWEYACRAGKQTEYYTGD